MSRRLHHVGRVVADLDRSVAFYSGPVGLGLLASGRESDPRYAEMLGVERVAFRWAELDLGDGQVLELLQFELPVAPSPPAGDGVTPGSSHIGIRVADIDRVYDDLERAGVGVLSRPIELQEDNHWLGTRVFYARDPDGAMVEFIQEGPASA